MPPENYETVSLTTNARQRLLDLRAVFTQFGVPKGFDVPKIMTLSAVVELMCAISEREIKKGKRR
jgi:hypothetical protein